MKPTILYSSEQCEVWHGDSLDPETAETVMRGRVAQLLHVDAPYSERTHSAHGRTEKETLTRASIAPEPIPYDGWSPDMVSRFCSVWLPVTEGWATTVTDHNLAKVWESEFSASERYTFAPLAWVETGSRIRLAGDGPSQWSCWAVVARPRSRPWNKWGTLPGAYVAPGEQHSRPERIIGGKSLRMTAAFISDYSRPGDLVLDPCFGGATTGLACLMTGRRVIGVEIDEARADECARLLRDGRVKVPEKQEALF